MGNPLRDLKHPAARVFEPHLVPKSPVETQTAMLMPTMVVMRGLLTRLGAFLFIGLQMLQALELPAGPFANLKSEEFRVRESAQAEILTWARERREAAMDELHHQSVTADDPEVRERCLAVLRELVNDEYLQEGEGYIGIRMQDENANIPDDPKPRSVIRVVQVVPDSAAHQAGLQLNDLIIGLGDTAWHEGKASLVFGESIRQIKPGTRITLRILRDGGMMDLVVKLGRRPLAADNPFFDQRQVDLEAAERTAKEAYFRRWLERRKPRN